MRRRIFLSFQHEDRQQASGFNLLQWNPNVDFDFVERHLLSPADSTDQDYIRSRIREELNGTSVTIVLVGQRTAESEWVDFEMGIRLKDSEESPVPAALEEAEARVIEWNPSHFSDEIERAALIAGRPDLGPPAAQAPASPGRDCAR